MTDTAEKRAIQLEELRRAATGLAISYAEVEQLKNQLSTVAQGLRAEADRIDAFVRKSPHGGQAQSWYEAIRAEVAELEKGPPR